MTNLPYRICPEYSHPLLFTLYFCSTSWFTTITKTSLFKYTEIFTTTQWKFSYKNSNIFHISAQNIDCVYSLEPPRRGGSNEYHNLCFE